MEDDLIVEPAWLNLENDRKTPYTDAEIEEYVNSFIQEFPEYFNELVKDNGPNTTKIILRNRFKAGGENREMKDGLKSL